MTPRAALSCLYQHTTHRILCSLSHCAPCLQAKDDDIQHDNEAAEAKDKALSKFMADMYAHQKDLKAEIATIKARMPTNVKGLMRANTQGLSSMEA